MNALFIKDKVCAQDANTFMGKFGWFFAFFGDGTDCRCCLGMRIVLAWSLGLFMGYMLAYLPAVGIAIAVTFAVTAGLFFFVWLMIQAQTQREEYEESMDIAIDRITYEINEQVEEYSGGRGLRLSHIENIRDDYKRFFGKNPERYMTESEFIKAKVEAVLKNYQQEEQYHVDLQNNIIKAIISGVEKKTGEPVSDSYRKILEDNYKAEGMKSASDDKRRSFIKHYIDLAEPADNDEGYPSFHSMSSVIDYINDKVKENRYHGLFLKEIEDIRYTCRKHLSDNPSQAEYERVAETYLKRLINK